MMFEWQEVVVMVLECQDVVVKVERQSRVRLADQLASQKRKLLCSLSSQFLYKTRN